MPIDNAPADAPTPIPPRPVIRYANLAGAEVHITPDLTPHPGEYVWNCTGCLDDRGFPTDIDRVRTWASEHAAQCRALPQPTD